MTYLERWEVWLVAILFILILIYFWCKNRSTSTEDTPTSNTGWIEEVPTQSGDTLTTLSYSVYDVEPSRILALPYGTPVPLQHTLPVPTTKDQSAGEKKCTEVVRSIYPYEEIVLQTRPSLLKNPETGRNLELDIYIPRLKLAWEYDGKQHAQVVKRFHPNGQADLDAQKKRDELKNELCKRAGIYLTRIPHTVKINQIEDYIRHHLPSNR